LTAREVLKQHFGYDAFRRGQEKLIDDILTGKDVLGIMPTGAGKSVCFQVPALMMGGVTIIISPLISLMKDQVSALTQSGIAAAFINSSLNERQIAKVLYRAANGAYKLIYVAPERLLAYDFISFAKSAEVSMLTVDEAHCISQWGQDFRPSYARIPEFIERLGRRPVLSAFTATATPIVREDIASQLALSSPTILVSGFDRQNLYFEVQKPKDKFSALASFLRGRRDHTGIVYCSTRAAVEEVCDKLRRSGYGASRYHAGLSDSERRDNQDDFLYDRAQVMVATNAFGMGIDKSNVSFVIHYNMPMNIEGYYQEAGRAGRDGEPADCVLFYSARDVQTNQWLIDNARDVEYPDKATEDWLKQREKQRLNEMALYCATNDCLRSYILAYFGESPPERCGNCVNCNTSFETADITVEAQKILSCVFRMSESYGMTMVINVLRGSRNEKLLRMGLDKLSTYGISEKTDKRLQEIMNHMIMSGYLIKTADKYPVIKLGPRARDVLRGGESVYIKLSRSVEPEISEQRYGSVNPVDKDLLARLKELRLTIAREQKVPAFIILHDSSLTDMCMKLPSTPEEFLRVSGVGRAKADAYGERFLSVIAEFLSGAGSASGGESTASAVPKQFDAAQVEISQDPVSVSIVADRINCALIESGHARISGQRINDWLVSQGCMTVTEQDTKSFKTPTALGERLGITTQRRVIRGQTMDVNVFSAAAQEYVTANALTISGSK